MSDRQGLAGQQALFAWLNLALTAPSVYLWLGLPLVLRQHGWSGVALGLFQLAALPAVFKFLLARPVEGGHEPQRHYRAWAIGLCLAAAATLLLLGWSDLLDSPLPLFALAFAAALLTTWADVPINALAIRRLPASEHARAGGLRSAALSLGAIVGAGVMLMLQLRWGWRVPFWVLAGMLVLGALLLAASKDLESAEAQRASPRAAVSLRKDFQNYLQQPGAKPWTLLLMLYFPFVGTAWFYLKPLLLDLGFEALRVAQLVGIGGGLVAAASSLATIAWVRRIGMRRAVPAGAWFGFLSLSLLALAIGVRSSGLLVFIAAACIAACVGNMAALAFGLTIHFARKDAAAVDYGLQSSLFAFSRLVIPAIGGVLLDRTGPVGLLICLALGMLGVCLLFVKTEVVLPSQMPR